MAIRRILTIDNAADLAILKAVSPPAEGGVTDDLRALMDDMLETMYAAPGIGLAAVQIGELKRVVVMDLGDKVASRASRTNRKPRKTPWRAATRATSSTRRSSGPRTSSSPMKIRLVGAGILRRRRTPGPRARSLPGLCRLQIEEEIEGLYGRLLPARTGPPERRPVHRPPVAPASRTGRRQGQEERKARRLMARKTTIIDPRGRRRLTRNQKVGATPAWPPSSPSPRSAWWRACCWTVCLISTTRSTRAASGTRVAASIRAGCNPSHGLKAWPCA